MKRINQLRTNKLKTVIYLPSSKKLPAAIKNILDSNFYFLNSAIIVMMGAGDIVNLTPKLLK